MFVVPSPGTKVRLVRIAPVQGDGGREAPLQTLRPVKFSWRGIEPVDEPRRAVGVSGKKHVVHVVLAE